MYSHTPDNSRSVFGIWSRSVCTSDQPTMKSCIDHNDAIWNIIRVELVVNPVLPKIFWITSENYFKRWCFSSQPLFSIVTQRVWEGICVTRPNNNGCDHPRQLSLTACQVYKTVKCSESRSFWLAFVSSWDLVARRLEFQPHDQNRLQYLLCA